jgi:hypothetical protein
MRAKRFVTAVAFAAFALAVTGCGAVKVQPSTQAGSSKLASRGAIDSPLTKMRNHLACLRDAHLSVRVASPTRLQVGSAPGGPTIVFSSTPGAAQAYQINGSAQGAMVIGSALVYPNHGSDREMSTIGSCLAQGVQG